MYCLYCHEQFSEKISWHYVFGFTTPPLICEQCDEKLQPITTGEICEKCGRPFSLLEPQYRVENLCSDCVRWNGQNGALVKNRSLYVYNDFLQEVIAKWKYRGDAELVKMFWKPLKKLVSQFQVDVVVPIPLSNGRLYDRGFNQAMLLCKGLPYEVQEVLKRPQEAEKQSKKSRKERLERKEKFQITPSTLYNVKGKSVLIVDDIYTTGATLYSAAEVLVENGASDVFSVTVARG